MDSRERNNDLGAFVAVHLHQVWLLHFLTAAATLYNNNETWAAMKLVERRIDFGERAPISEALIDIRVTARDDLDPSDLKLFSESWPERFPICQLQLQSEIRVDAAGGTMALESNSGTLGYAFINSDNDKVAQVQTGGFSFSKLPPYQGWNHLLTEFQELWSTYLELSRPHIISRLGLRFINRIPLPANCRIEISDYLNFNPNSPGDLGEMSEFFMRTVIHHPSTPGITGAVAVASDSANERFMFIFDIDVFIANANLSPQSSEIWLKLEQLRDYKNDIFFGGITQLVEKSLK
jgi:uncharacterized protein (TIGR04255 family)